MLRLSKITDYGVLILRTLAAQQGQLSAREIGERIQVALPTVSKVLKLLVSHRLVTSERGSSGGYQLALAPNNINITQIVCALEGDIAITECGSTGSSCRMHDHCALKPNWQIVNEVIFTILNNVTLADMMNELSTEQVLQRMMAEAPT